MSSDGVILARGGVIDECPGCQDALEKTYTHEISPITGTWALCPVCERWYTGPAGIPVPYAHTRDGWVTEADDTSAPHINKIWPNYSIPASRWQGADYAWKLLRIIGIANGARDPIGGLPGADRVTKRTEEVSSDKVVDLSKFAKATQRGITRTNLAGQQLSRKQRRAQQRQANRRRHGR